MFHVKQITFGVIVRGADVREVDIYSIKDIVKLTLFVFINGGCRYCDTRQSFADCAVLQAKKLAIKNQFNNFIELYLNF